jgi:Nuclease-related domain
VRVVTNRRYVQTRARLGRLMTLGGFAALLGGLIYSFAGLGTQDQQAILVSYVALIAGYLLISIGKNYWLRFSVHPRPDESLALNLKTLDVRHVLFNYVSALPVAHLLLTPSGLIVIETRPFIGDIQVRGDRWSRRRGVMGWLQFLSEGALGNPTRDARRGVDEIRGHLAGRLGPELADRVPIQGLIVFTHPRVALTIEEPTVAVAHARDAREAVRRVAGGPRLVGDVARKVEAALLEDARPAGEPVTAAAAVERKARRRASRAR